MSELEKLLGNKKSIEHFEAAAGVGRLQHAYIINGEEGSGKETFVKWIAAGLLCDEEGITPCMKCPSCIKVLTGNHPDLIFVSHEKKTVISVDEIRHQLVETIQIRPYIAPYKIYVIENAELLNQSGQNAILKTLEEPPEYAIIFLLTDKPETLLQTIHSRCMEIEMEKLPDEIIIKALKEEFSGSQDEIKEAVAFSRGNLGKAKEILNKKGAYAIKEKAADVIEKLEGLDAFEIDQIAKELKDLDKQKVLDDFLIWFRDVLVFKANKDESNLYFLKNAKEIKSQAEKISFERINNILMAIENAKREALVNVNAEALFETLLLKIRTELKNKN